MVLRFLISGIAGLRADLTVHDVAAQINAIQSETTLRKLIERLLEPVPLPPPLWLGSETIRPITSIKDLRDHGLKMKNCLRSIEIIASAIRGDAAFYVVSGSEPCVIGLTRHHLFGLWYLDDIKAASNKAVSCVHEAELKVVVLRAGFADLNSYELENLLPQRDFL